MTKNNFRRFIAGAVCPSCHLFDKIVFEKTVDHQSIYCTRCGYNETRKRHDDDYSSSQTRT